MKLLVLETIIDGRSSLARGGKGPPYVVHLTPKRAARLRQEMSSIGVPFGLPLAGEVPDSREDGEDYEYFGLILSDVHVYGRVDPAPSR